MPKATVTTDTEKRELKSLDGAFVELRKLSYGEILKQRGLMQSVSGLGSGNADGKGPRLDFRFEESRQYEFERCIVDHNLEDENGKKLNFANKGVLTNLDPQVAQEIEGYIDEMNEPPSEEQRATFPQASENGDTP